MIERKVSVRVNVAADNSQMDAAFTRSRAGVEETTRSVSYLQRELKGIQTPDVGFKFAKRDADRMREALAEVYRGGFSKIGVAGNSTIFNLSEPLRDSKQIARTLKDVTVFDKLEELFRSGKPGWLRAFEKMGDIAEKGMFSTFRMLAPGQGGSGGSIPLAEGAKDIFGFAPNLPTGQFNAHVQDFHKNRSSILSNRVKEMTKRLDRDIAVAGMKPEEIGVFDMQQSLREEGLAMSPEQMAALSKKAREAARAREDAAAKGMWSGKRAFAGGGWAGLALLAQVMPQTASGGFIGETLGSASAGAGIGTMLGGPMGALGGAFIGAVITPIKHALDTLIPSVERVAKEFEGIAQSFEASGRVAYESRISGRATGGGASILYPSERAAISESVARSGGFGTEGGEAGGMAAIRADLAARRAATSEVLSAFEAMESAVMRDRDRAAIRAERERFTAGTEFLEVAARGGGIDTLTRPEIPGVSSSGGASTITDTIMSGLRERPIIDAAAAEILARSIMEAAAAAGWFTAGAFAAAPGGPS